MIKKLKKQYEYCLSFFITALIIVFAFAVNGIYPGSDKSILIFDLGAQYVSFFSYLFQLGSGYNTLMFQTVSSLGGGFFGTWAYYLADPLSFIVLLFGRSNLPLALYFLTILKLSLCSLSFSIYCKNGRLKCDNKFLIVLSSVAYGLMSYTVFYSMNLMWIDGVIMLPIVILGVDLVLEKDQAELLIVSLAVSVIINYYTAYMIILFVILYFVYRFICGDLTFKRFITKGVRLFISGLISGMISAFVWLPVFFDLKRGKLTEESKSLSGLIRNPISVFRQFLPCSYGGFQSKAAPSIYCGLIITALFLIYFFIRKISIRKKIAAFSVFAVFVVSLCWDRGDVLWHAFQIPNFFPARYSFAFSFFILCVSVECGEILLKSISETCKYKAVVPLLVFIGLVDCTFNSCYLIHSLDNDPVTGGYIKSIYYDYHFYMNELIKEYIPGNSRIVVDSDYSSNDGYLFGISSLDSYSSSYNLSLSLFFRNIGLNANHHEFSDLGLNPLSASLLGVDYYAEIYKGLSYNSLTDYFDPVYDQDDLCIYENPYSMPPGFMISDESDGFTYNVFENVNAVSSDLGYTEDIFIECSSMVVNIDAADEQGIIRTEYTVQPVSGDHLYFYVSPEDYYDKLDGNCYDVLYLGDNCIATYINVGNRYMVDLGISDGTPLVFTFDSKSDLSRVWFYSFDHDKYLDMIKGFDDGLLTDVVYDSKGITGSISLSEDSDVVLMLPYEKGYIIKIDGSLVQYDDYRDSLVKIHIPKGSHTIHLRYVTPGLKTGFLISAIGLILLSVSIIITFKKRKKANN